MPARGDCRQRCRTREAAAGLQPVQLGAQCGGVAAVEGRQAGAAGGGQFDRNNCRTLATCSALPASAFSAARSSQSVTSSWVGPPVPPRAARKARTSACADRGLTRTSAKPACSSASRMASVASAVCASARAAASVARRRCSSQVPLPSGRLASISQASKGPLAASACAQSSATCTRAGSVASAADRKAALMRSSSTNRIEGIVPGAEFMAGLPADRGHSSLGVPFGRHATIRPLPTHAA